MTSSTGHRQYIAKSARAIVQAFVGALTILGFACTAAAFQSETAGAMAKYFSGHVHSLKQPVTVYNWWDASRGSAELQGSFGAADPIGYENFAAASRIYWERKGRPQDGVNQGPGLYVAMDPVITMSYGRGPRWLLTQIRIPRGFRIVDLMNAGLGPVPGSVQTLLRETGCFTEDALTSEKELFRFIFKNQIQDKDCIALVRSVFDEKLRVDAFAYGYDVSYFKECPAVSSTDKNAFDRSAAFVIINSRSIRPPDVRVFNSKTLDAEEDRLRIQSFFYKAAADGAKDGPYPVPVEPGPRVPILWEDLKGKNTVSDLGSWIRDNVYACPGIRPY